MKNYINIIVLFIGALFCSCSGNNKEQNKAKEEFERGVVHSKIVCKSDSLQSYAMYLPYSYNPAKKHPVVFCFDSQGRGALPVALFKDAAEKYGYLIIGSNNSRNGKIEEIHRAANAMFEDCYKRLAINPERVYLCGFSGGARVAGYLLANSSDFAGLIACGAGYISENQNVADLDYFGIIGFEDMNYGELVKTDLSLATKKCKHRMLLFNGTHEWPGEKELNIALEWITIQAIQRGKMKKEPVVVDSYYMNAGQEMRDAEKAGMPFYSGYLIRCCLSDLDGLIDLKFPKKAFLNFNKQFNLQQLQTDFVSAINKENNEVMRYLTLIKAELQNPAPQIDAKKWKKEVEKVQSMKKTTSGDVYFRAKRMENLVCLSTSIQYKRFLKNKDTKRAKKMLDIFTFFRPNDWEAEYLKACWEIAENNTQKSFKHLNTSFDKGLKNKIMFVQDGFFADYLQNADLQDLLKRF